jgi:hypothetical protein
MSCTWYEGSSMAKPDQKLAAFRWKMTRKLQKPVGGRGAAPAEEVPAGVELHAPDPEVHARGSEYHESEKAEPGVVCPSCKSPAHAHDTKCPWCGAAIPQS